MPSIAHTTTYKASTVAAQAAHRSAPSFRAPVVRPIEALSVLLRYRSNEHPHLQTLSQLLVIRAQDAASQRACTWRRDMHRKSRGGGLDIGGGSLAREGLIARCCWHRNSARWRRRTLKTAREGSCAPRERQPGETHQALVVRGRRRDRCGRWADQLGERTWISARTQKMSEKRGVCARRYDPQRRRMQKPCALLRSGPRVARGRTWVLAFDTTENPHTCGVTNTASLRSEGWISGKIAKRGDDNMFLARWAHVPCPEGRSYGNFNR